MREALNFIHTLTDVTLVELDAQYHLESFYAPHEFHSIGEPYDDGSILHIKMILLKMKKILKDG